MNKRKTVFVATLAFLLLAAGVLGTMYEYFAGQMRARITSELAAREAAAKALFTNAARAPDAAMLAFMETCGSDLGNMVPYYAALADKTGAVLAETRDTLLCRPQPHGNDEAAEEPIRVDLALTDALRGELRAAAGGDYSGLSVPCVSLGRKDGAYVPVQMEIGDIDTNRGIIKTRTVTFCDLPVERTLPYPALLLYSVNRNKKTQALLIKMRENTVSLQENLRQYIADRKAESDDWRDWFDDASLLDESVVEMLAADRDGRILRTVLPLERGGERVFFIMKWTSRLPALVLHWYYLEFAAAGVLLLFVYCAALIFALWYRNRRAALETSRYSFLAAAAHELKTPLSVMLSAGECIAEGVSPEKNAEYAGMILHEGARMKALLEDMLRENRLLSAADVNRTFADLSALVTAETEKYLPAARQKGLDLQTEIAPGLTGRFDPELLAVALDNYLSNAVKYAPAGETVTVRAEPNGRAATVTVHNTGSRIPAAALPHVWEELYREDAVRGDGAGSGLGLSIARRIFRLHRMKYGCSSNETGTSFRFTVPLVKRQKDTAHATNSEKPRRRYTLGERLGMLSVLFIAGSLPALAFILYAESNVAFYFAFGFAVLGEFAGLLSILSTLLLWRDKTRKRRRLLFVLTVLAAALPPLIYAFFYIAGANGW